MNTKGPRDALHALVLGAGAGSRFGGGKLLAPWPGGRVLEGALAAAFAAPVERVWLTVGADGEAVAAAARGWADGAGVSEGLGVIAVPHWNEGMAASLRTGVLALPHSVAGLYVFLGDMPRVPPAVLGPMAEALRGGAPAVVPTFEGRRGHPALMGAALFGEVARLKGDQGAKGLLDGLGSGLAEVAAPDDGVLFDVDTPADLD